MHTCRTIAGKNIILTIEIRHSCSYDEVMIDFIEQILRMC